eukprot:s91_g17.t1
MQRCEDVRVYLLQLRWATFPTSAPQMREDREHKALETGRGTLCIPRLTAAFSACSTFPKWSKPCDNRREKH